jgi:hypothetical protein
VIFRLYRLWKHDRAMFRLHSAAGYMLQRTFATVDIGDLLAAELLIDRVEAMIAARKLL